MDKVVATTAEAVAGIRDGVSLAVGGPGLSGLPNELIKAVYELGIPGIPRGRRQLRRAGLGARRLPAAGRTARVRGSYIGANREFTRRYRAVEIEVKMIPQGTPTERLRAGCRGIPAFHTPTPPGSAPGSPRAGCPGATRYRLLTRATPSAPHPPYPVIHGAAV
jgi:3-oxoacid CoA-transferase subunit A